MKGIFETLSHFQLKNEISKTLQHFEDEEEKKKISIFQNARVFSKVSLF